MTPKQPDAPTQSEILRRLVADATRWLETNAAAVDALNVYPVPDGDTGSNMLSTMRAGLAAAQGDGDDLCGDDLCRVVDALAHGTLLGARGNSGVILSQICRGLAEGITAGGGSMDANGLAGALRQAADRAYGAVVHPVEGTMLTVIRAAAQAAEAAAAGAESVADVLAAATAGAQRALAQTPELLPVLKQAGVVDAGGQGVVLLLEGALASMRGEPLADPVGSLGEIDRGWLASSMQHAEEHDGWGYCTQFVVEAPVVDADGMRAHMPDDATSVLVVGDQRALHVHLHTMDPGAALTAGVALGTLHNMKIDNMSDQHAALAAQRLGGGPTEPENPAAIRLPVVAVVPGAGLARVCRALGAGHVVMGGQSMNPSLQEIVDAARALPGDSVILLPNNPNVQLVCGRAHELLDKRVLVVPTATVLQGIAALLAGEFADDVEGLAAAMEAGMSRVRSIEVTTATRTVVLDGVQVTEGQSVALLDRRIVASEANPVAALQAALDAAGSTDGSLVTLYYGEGVSSSEAEAAATALRQRADAPEVDVVDGGQPHYPYLASVES